MLAAIWFSSDLDDLDGSHAPSETMDGRARRALQEQERENGWVVALADADSNTASAALSALLAAYFDRLVRFAYGFVAATDVAEDIVQDTFVSVWDARIALRLTCSFRAYLFTAVRHRALNVLKHQAVEARYVTNAQATAEPATLGVDERLDAAAIERAVRAAIALLPERRRTVLRLRYEEELSFHTVAEIMGISEKAAKDLTARTVRELRVHLGLP